MKKLILPKPKLESVPLAEGLAWSVGDGLIQEKADGVHAFLDCGGGTVCNAERMPSGLYVVNDLVTLAGEDVRRASTRHRWAALMDAFQDVKKSAAFQDVKIELARVGSGGEFLEYILAHGGEGCVSKPWSAPFGVCWQKCKRFETFDLRVVEIDEARGSLHLAADTGEDRGWCPARSAFQAVKIGDVVEVGGYGLTRAGKIREPRFVRLRDDKL